MSSYSEAEAALLAAIGAKCCVSATYNRRQMVLAPHAMFERNGARFLRAVTLELDGGKPRETKLGTFNLAGLRDLQLTRKLFRPERELLSTFPSNDAETLVAMVA